MMSAIMLIGMTAIALLYLQTTAAPPASALSLRQMLSLVNGLPAEFERSRRSIAFSIDGGSRAGE